MRGLLGRKADSWGRRCVCVWGARSGTQSLAQRPQQMATEQRDCRETLGVHSERPREMKGERERRASHEGRDQKPHTVKSRYARLPACCTAAFWEMSAVLGACTYTQTLAIVLRALAHLTTNNTLPITANRCFSRSFISEEYDQLAGVLNVTPS